MDLISIDLNHIVDLGTQIGTSGAIRALEQAGDDVFDYVIGIAILIHELHR